MIKFFLSLIIVLFVTATARSQPPVHYSPSLAAKHSYYKTTGHRPGYYGANPYQHRINIAIWQAQNYQLQIQRNMYPTYNYYYPVHRFQLQHCR